MSNHIIMATGLPGTGKSTLSKKLEKRLDYDRHSTPSIRDEFGYSRYNPKQDPLVWNKLHEKTEQSLQSGRGVVLESTFSRQKSRHGVYEISVKYGVDILLIECHCAEAMAKRRMRTRPKREGLFPDPRGTYAYDREKGRWVDPIKDFSSFPYAPLSYVRYNTEPNAANPIQKVKVNPNVRQLVDRIKEIIKL